MMGDYADDAIEAGFLEYDYALSGEDEEFTRDYFEAVNAIGFWRKLIGPIGKTCRKCGAKKLQWKQHGSGKWWLVEQDGEWHTCKEDSNESQ